LLFCFVGASGHFEPLAPVARAALDARHEVLFACQDRMADTVRARGFEAIAVGPPARAPQRLPLVEPDPEREDQVLREVFATGRARERATALRGVAADFDVLVHDESDFGAPIAAELAGVPSVAVEINAAGSFFRPELLAPPLRALRAEFALAGDPEPQLVLSPFPPSFRDPAHPRDRYAFRARSAPLAAGDTVYFTLGTVFNLESGDLFERVLAGLHGRRAIVTVGNEVDPAELGTPPPGVRIERFVDQAEVLPHCCAVVSHGGSGSLLGAFAHGLPSVLLAMGADQLHNAARAEAVGVARCLHPVRATPADIAAAVSQVIEQPSYREAAVRLHHEIAALPGPERAVELLVQRLSQERHDPLT
jgi:UDP:flavonoid glycosyltransferase YjiC (YdhE family)